MDPIYSSQAKEDKAYWAKHVPKILKRLDQLTANIRQNFFIGIGKPEPLRFKQAGYWSRRINHEHRLIYKVVDGQIYIAQCRYVL